VIRIHQGCTPDGIVLIIQSIFSYISDVETLGQNSIWHPLDRYFAIFTCIFHFYTLNFISFLVNLILLIVGYLYLIESQILYENNDSNFAFNHTLWHLTSIFMAVTSNL
jgi:hypothetical protein